jgi:putative ABC transport system permease protein
MLRTFTNLLEAPIGFDPAHVVTARIPLSLQRVSTVDRRSAFYRDAIARVRELPGVDAASVGGPLPLAPIQTTQRVGRREDRSDALIGMQRNHARLPRCDGIRYARAAHLGRRHSL